MPIPLAMGLLGADGEELPTRLDGEREARTGTRVLSRSPSARAFRFVDVPAPPVPSLLRGFSAPVKLRGVPLDRLKFLAVHDTDPFARWEAGQQVATRVLLDRIAAHAAAVPRCRRSTPTSSRRCGGPRRRRRATRHLPPKPWPCRARPISPSQMPVVDVEAIHAARESARAELGAALAEALRDCLPAVRRSRPLPDRRRLDRPAGAAQCLSRLSRRRRSDEGRALAMAQFDAGANMTDVLAALMVLADIDCPERDAGARAFYKRWSRRCW